jgi:S1-C subfamily serine protease
VKRFAVWTLLASTLVLTPVVALPADVMTMTNANYLFRANGVLCSSTLFDKTERWALTNYHCIEDSIRTVEREIVSPDGTVKKISKIVREEVSLSQPAYGPTGRVGELTLTAEILAFDKDRDLAVLRILSETTPLLASAKIAPDGYKLAQGQVVWAIGNPIGLENTVTRGVVSHLFREVDMGGDYKARFIQTDATITGGSSGGALYSDDGYLVGVPSAGYRGVAINFAIPFEVFKRFLRDNGFARAWDDTAPSRDDFLKAKKTDGEKK